VLIYLIICEIASSVIQIGRSGSEQFLGCMMDGQDIVCRSSSGTGHVEYCHIPPIFHLTPGNISMMKYGNMDGGGATS
jgi:hypothetical protein